jgi:hydrogenase maturation protease
MRLVVFGWGNVSRGDDGVGPLLLARLQHAGWDETELIEDYQLQLEHALDLKGADLALFIDAGKDTPAPFVFHEIAPHGGMSHTSHALSPESVLDVYRQIEGAEPPPGFLLCVRGESFGLGEGLSELGAARLERAWVFLRELGETRTASAWREALARRGPSTTKA